MNWRGQRGGRCGGAHPLHGADDGLRGSPSAVTGSAEVIGRKLTSLPSCSHGCRLFQGLRRSHDGQLARHGRAGVEGIGPDARAETGRHQPHMPRSKADTPVPR